MKEQYAYLLARMSGLRYRNAANAQSVAQCTNYYDLVKELFAMVVECTEQSIKLEGAELSTRLYRDDATPRSAPLVLHLHGGAFIDGSLEGGRTIATLLAEAGAIVVSAGYPLAPESRFPKSLEVSFRALKYMHCKRAAWSGKKSGLYVAGEEAGGNIAAGLALMSRDQNIPPLAGQILVSPMLDPFLATKSVREAEVGPVGCRWADGWNQYLGRADKACHPYATPLGSSRLRSLAPALIITAQDDPLRDECLCYAERLNDAGIDVQFYSLNDPTGWPETLSRFENIHSSWASALREQFVGFFTHTTSSVKAPTTYQTGKA
jgi:acetyl esterase/lipase